MIRTVLSVPDAPRRWSDTATLSDRTTGRVQRLPGIASTRWICAACVGASKAAY